MNPSRLRGPRNSVIAPRQCSRKGCPELLMRSARIGSEHVEERTGGERLRGPEARVGKPAATLVGIRGAGQGEGAAVLEEPAEGHAARAPELDEGELRHGQIARRTFHDGHLPRAVEDHRRQFPRLDKLGEAARRVGRPRPARPVGVFLHRVLRLPGLLEAVEEAGRPPGGRRPTADQDAGRAKALQPRDVGAPHPLPPGQVIRRRGHRDVVDDHRSRVYLTAVAHEYLAARPGRRLAQGFFALMPSMSRRMSRMRLYSLAFAVKFALMRSASAPQASLNFASLAGSVGHGTPALPCMWPLLPYLAAGILRPRGRDPR